MKSMKSNLDIVEISAWALNGIDPVTKLVVAQFLHNWGILVMSLIVVVVMVGVHYGKCSHPIWVSPLDRAQKLQKYRATNRVNWWVIQGISTENLLQTRINRVHPAILPYFWKPLKRPSCCSILSLFRYWQEWAKEWDLCGESTSPCFVVTLREPGLCWLIGCPHSNKLRVTDS